MVGPDLVGFVSAGVTSRAVIEGEWGAVCGRLEELGVVAWENGGGGRLGKGDFRRCGGLQVRGGTRKSPEAGARATVKGREGGVLMELQDLNR
ncbi:hypothetical protein TIFTF001_055996 [Ficus carica]|nr:hypothetical protein TIFTF001_055993 [Ficus carica]GMN72140.1 hypothetical protein TIFTF001_055996 [Ficus carica]